MSAAPAGPLVSCEWLKENLANVKVLDASWYVLSLSLSLSFSLSLSLIFSLSFSLSLAQTLLQVCANDGALAWRQV